MPESTLSPQLFAIFANLVEEHCGLHYGPQDRELFAAKLSSHALDHGFDNLLDYYYRLRYDDPGGDGLRKLVEALVVHETYFFRELAPLVQLVNGHLRETVEKRGRARVWSAACATGEEPYTLAMLLDERRLLKHVDIVATDLSTAALERARAGRYGRRSLRDGYPSEVARQYLEMSSQTLLVIPKIRDAVQFSAVNLLDSEATGRLGTFDAILCRNVLIYFGDEHVRRVVRGLCGSLTSGGLLAVGVSESLLRFGPSLICEERGNAFFYRCAS